MRSVSARRPIVIASRCAWTLYNFRLGLIRRLEGSGEPVVALGAKLDGYEDQLRAAGVDFRATPVPLKGVAPLGDAWLFLSYVWRFWRLKPKVVHLFTIKPVIYGALAARVAGVPATVCTITGLGYGFMSGDGWLNRIVERLYRAALANAHVVFFQNEDDRRLFLERGLVAPGKTRLVAGSGVDTGRFAVARLAPGLPDRPATFLMLSRLLRHKGVLEFMEAAQRLADQGVKARFVLVGAEDARNPSALTPAELDALRRSPVEWPGAVEDVRPAIAAADVIVLPSYREGAPRSLLEGMAMGRPIVTTDAVGCRDMVVDGINGFRVPVADADALAAAMTRFAAHPEDIEPMGRRARRFVEDGYSEAAVIDATLAAYAEASRDPDRSPARA